MRGTFLKTAVLVSLLNLPVTQAQLADNNANVEKVNIAAEQQIEIEESGGDVLTGRDTPASLEEMMKEFSDNNFHSSGGVLGVTDAPVVPELQNDAINRIKGTGIWGFQFIYYNKAKGTYTILSENRVHEALKPASTLKLFTGWLSYVTASYPVTSVQGTMTKKGYRANLNEMLRRSDNEIAEATLRSVATKLGHVEIPNNGVDELKDAGLMIMKNSYEPLDDSALFEPKNGSGLNQTDVDPEEKLNKVTARTMVNLLQKIRERGADYEKFKNLLARPGGTGTLVNRFAATRKLGNVYGKTGTLARTKSLAGFVDTKAGTLIFSIIGDKLTVRPVSASEQIDNIVYVHTRYLVKKGL